MGRPEVLSRAQADLERGHTRLARQRLVGLLADDPQDLDVRARLADVYRREGNLAEAGRWAFLTEDAEPRELAAFAKQYRSATERLRVLRLRGENPRELGPLAEPRYTELVARAAAQATVKDLLPEPVPDDPRPVERITPKPVAKAPAGDWSLSDILCLLVVFGPPTVALGVILYELVVAAVEALIH
ncbi:DUF6584 family protein [Actinoplanes couchii]|uniref:Uncharacterized protein n=1 Tax=Actinoplanes couchii TaxID=403638 RepID=A0ABQ3XKQ2_9ACTN|nr:DUF6584 family protein [Actinoplanes couchii]MDR6319542.1 hypothetical protein [Actinoplanes couchii]GID59068.1 hypothetical protein Aco03nite_074720 [Actinoplanes couchii]